MDFYERTCQTMTRASTNNTNSTNSTNNVR